MKYQKPDLKVLDTAVEAVQTVQSKGSHVLDQTPIGVGPAYEADE